MASAQPNGDGDVDPGSDSVNPLARAPHPQGPPNTQYSATTMFPQPARGLYVPYVAWHPAAPPSERQEEPSRHHTADTHSYEQAPPVLDGAWKAPDPSTTPNADTSAFSDFSLEEGEIIEIGSQACEPDTYLQPPSIHELSAEQLKREMELVEERHLAIRKSLLGLADTLREREGMRMMKEEERKLGEWKVRDLQGALKLQEMRWMELEDCLARRGAELKAVD
ncbi:hypothetical protein EK21DRAFT_112687 [Setomelanomma holmii]|uniref:Uncharacterized protein n=1 Tax=Setomelanomma holmii TaxID=210430 RepID=A0A9P4HAM8_9PLEO|nr:hypothetical protein EK21DRAFT_112687 [Setomelanomma holmii]